MLHISLSRRFYIGLIVLICSLISFPMALHAESPDGTEPVKPYGEVPANPNPNPVNPATSNNQPGFPQEVEGAAFTDNLPNGNPNPVERVVGDNAMLNSNPDVCLDFDEITMWKGDTSRRQYAGWGNWAKDDGGNYHKENINFNDEQDYKNGKFSMKISSDKPFMGQLISPQFKVTANAQITVAVSYYIASTDIPGERNDSSEWMSIDVHAVPENIAFQDDTPSNGYRKGLWVRRESKMTMGNVDGYIQIVLQANNIQHNNNAIYFDNIEIWVNGKSQKDCTSKRVLIGGPTPVSKSNAKPRQQFLIASDTKNRTISTQNLDDGGKISIWSDLALDEERKNKIGVINTYCLRPIGTSTLECQWAVITVTTLEGTLTIAGTNYTKSTNTFSIIGSTGVYSIIKGSVDLIADSNGNQSWYWKQ